MDARVEGKSITMNALRKVKRTIFPPPRKSPDGRDEWPSRTPYVLACMGGAMGFGNLLRFPSQVFNNNGIQWFIPYLMAVGMLAIPILILEVAIGQAYRSGCVIAFNGLDRRFSGVGFGMCFVGYAVAVYYIPILSWVMVYFRNSFQSANDFPWRENPQAYFDQVVNTVPPTLRYFAAPVLSIILLTFVWPRAMDIFVPAERRPEGTRKYAPQILIGVDDPNLVRGVGAQDEEGGLQRSQTSEEAQEVKGKDEPKVM